MLRKLTPLVKLRVVYNPNILCKPKQIHFILNNDALPKKLLFVNNQPQYNSIISRHYAKGKDIKKNKKKVLVVDEIELAEFFDVDKLFHDMNQPLENFKSELIEQTSLRTSAGAIENTKIQYEGKTYTIQDLAEVGKKNPNLYVLDFTNFPQTIPSVLSTFQKSQLNLNVQHEGTKLYVPIPKVTREHRELLSKRAKVCFIKCKDNIRDVQMKYIRKLKNIEKLGEETKFRITDQLTAAANNKIKLAEDILNSKQKELLHSNESSK